MENGSGRAAGGRKIFDGRSKNGNWDLPTRLNGSGWNCDGNVHYGRIHLAVHKHGYRTMMLVGIRVVMDQFMQRRTCRHCVQQQDKKSQ